MTSQDAYRPARRSRWTPPAWTVLLAPVLAALPPTYISREQSSPAAQEWFSESASAVGLDFVHFNGMSGEFYFEEMMGSGGALLDFDNDGDLDVYLIQGQMLGAGKTIADALMKPRMPLPLTDRLYRNDLEVRADGSRTLRFTDVTKGSGLDVRTVRHGRRHR